MLEIVFGNSEKGAMQCAQHFGRGKMSFSVPFYRTDGPKPTQEEIDAFMAEVKRKEEAQNRRGKPLGGNREDILGLNFVLDIGEISQSVTHAARRELLTAMYLDDSPPDRPGNHEESVFPQIDDSLTDFQTLLTRAGGGEPVRIWYSDAPGELCGFYHAVYALRDCPCPVSVIKLPRYEAMSERSAQSARGWGEVCPGDFASYLPLEREVPPAIRQAVVLEWGRLKRENAPLRAVVNGRLHSVGEDFYDPFLRAELPNGAFPFSTLLGNVIGNQRLGIGIWHLSRRVHRMISLGELRVVEEKPYYFQTILEKA